MSHELLLTAPGGVLPAPDVGPPLGPDEVRAVARARAISHGTAVNLYRTTSVFHTRHCDAARRIFRPGAQGAPDLLQMVLT